MPQPQPQPVQKSTGLDPTAPVTAWPPEVADALRLAAVRLRLEERAAAIDAAILRARAADPTDPVTDEHAADAAAHLEAARARRARAARAAGLPAADQRAAEAAADAEHRTTMQGRIAEWRRLRNVHQAMSDTPEAFGGVDLAGVPLDPAQQAEHVRAYAAAIAAAEADLAGD